MSSGSLSLSKIMQQLIESQSYWFGLAQMISCLFPSHYALYALHITERWHNNESEQEKEERTKKTKEHVVALTLRSERRTQLICMDPLYHKQYGLWFFKQHLSCLFAPDWICVHIWLHKHADSWIRMLFRIWPNSLQFFNLRTIFMLKHLVTKYTTTFFFVVNDDIVSTHNC